MVYNLVNVSVVVVNQAWKKDKFLQKLYTDVGQDVNKIAFLTLPSSATKARNSSGL